MASKKKALSATLPDGLFDLIPEDQSYWHFVWKKINNLLADYSFQRIDLAPAESTDLFVRAAGNDSDVTKRIISARSHGQNLAFRTDLSASLMRAYFQHNMQALSSPVKLFTSAPVVISGDRKPKMQWRLAVHTIGDQTEAVDAELLFLGCRILESMDIGQFTVRINTIGDTQSRTAYIKVLKEFLRHHARTTGARVQAALKIHPFHALEILATENAELAGRAPQAVEHLSDSSRLHFKRLLEFLDEGRVPYIIDHTLLPTIYSGFNSPDATTHTVWHFVYDAEQTDGTQTSPESAPIITGGRSDRLGEFISGTKVPSAGWGLDLGMIIERLKTMQVHVAEAGARPKVFLSQLGDAAKKRSLMLFEEIRKAGIEVRYSLSKDTIKGQLRMAARFGVRFALIFGQKEALEGTVMLRELESGIQETIPLEKIIDELKKRLKRPVA